jgi:hypothetical protein
MPLTSVHGGGVASAPPTAAPTSSLVPGVPPVGPHRVALSAQGFQAGRTVPDRPPTCSVIEVLAGVNGPESST